MENLKTKNQLRRRSEIYRGSYHGFCDELLVWTHKEKIFEVHHVKRAC